MRVNTTGGSSTGEEPRPRHTFAAMGFTLLFATTGLRAAEIVAPTQNVEITYEDTAWSSAINGPSVELRCLVDSCGGSTAECDITPAPIKDGQSHEQFFDAFQRDFTPGTLKQLLKAGIDAKVVDPPTSYMVGDRIAVESSIRYDEAGTFVRQWLVQIRAPFGVVAVVCYGDDDKFQAAKPQWLSLVKRIAFP